MFLKVVVEKFLLSKDERLIPDIDEGVDVCVI